MDFILMGANINNISILNKQYILFIYIGKHLLTYFFFNLLYN